MNPNLNKASRMVRDHPQPTLAIALLVSLLIVNLPFGGILLYPAKLFATWLHEFSHGLVMLATNNGFDDMRIYSDTSGLAYAARQAGPFSGVLITAAGYMGTPLWGALMLAVTTNGERARLVLGTLATVMLLSAMTVISNHFGQLACTIISIALLLSALLLPARLRLWLVHLIAAQACVNALLDIRILFRPQMVINGASAVASDAKNMALATLKTDAPWAQYVWASIWMLWSLAVLYWSLRHQNRQTAPR